MAAITTGQDGGGAPEQPGRRLLLKTAAIGGTGLVLNGLGVLRVFAQQAGPKAPQGMILVDYAACTGCRTCETACSAYNARVTVGGETLDGLGNPAQAHVRVLSYNPDVDVPVVCAQCGDRPCVAACPVEPDAAGHRALYRDDARGTLAHDAARCIGCRSCAAACRAQRAGAIVSDTATGKPVHLCTLCDGDPRCVKECPFDALHFIKGGIDGAHIAASPDVIARQLASRWYGAAARPVERTTR